MMVLTPFKLDLKCNANHRFKLSVMQEHITLGRAYNEQFSS